MAVRSVWNIGDYGIPAGVSTDESSVEHPSLGNHLPSNSIHPEMAELGYLEYRKAVLNQSYANETYAVLEQFVFEETELVSLLNRWLGMSQMYRTADISEYFARGIAPASDSDE